jgi:hypothetical protein
LKRLIAVGRIRIVKQGGGAFNTNQIELLLETLHTCAPFPATETSTETLHSEGLNPALRGPKPYTRVYPNLESLESLRTTPVNTGASGPRRRANALGPLEPQLQAELGERFGYLDAAKLDGHSADTVTLWVLNEHQANNIRTHCEADIRRVFEVTKLEFVFGLKAAPLTARGQP